jgi:general secretion pathway protein N
MASKLPMAKPKTLRAITNPQAALAPWVWAALGCLLGGLLTVLTFTPAQWLAQGVALLTQGQLQLQEARGTLWQGSARVVLTGGLGSLDAQALPGRIDWTLQSNGDGALLGLTSSCCITNTMQVQISPTWTGARIQITDTPSTWPAALLSGLGAPWNTLQPEGDLTLVPQQLRLQWLSGRLLVQGGLTLTAKDMASRLTPLKPMGTYQLQLDAGPSPTATPGLKLSTVSGSLLLSGQGQWVGQRLRFQGEASAVPEHEMVLNNLLSIIGRREGARSLLSWG